MVRGGTVEVLCLFRGQGNTTFLGAIDADGLISMMVRQHMQSTSEGLHCENGMYLIVDKATILDTRSDSFSKL